MNTPAVIDGLIHSSQVLAIKYKTSCPAESELREDMAHLGKICAVLITEIHRLRNQATEKTVEN